MRAEVHDGVRAASLRWIVPLAVAACSGQGPVAGPSIGGVVHLDLRLADGASAAGALARRRERVRSWTARGVGSRAVDLDAWEFHNAYLADGVGTTGLAVRAKAYDPSHGLDQARVHYVGTIDAARVNVIEVDAVVIPGSFCGLSWRRQDGTRGAAVANYASGADFSSARFLLAAHPQWSGAIDSLRIAPVQSGPQSYELESIRFAFDTFQAGPQPSSEDGVSTHGDGGLLGYGGDERRTWPSRIGEPLFARARIPPGGRVAVETAISTALHAGSASIRFTIEVRGAQGWETRASVLRAADGGERAWVPLVADLSDRQGQAVELRFLAAVDASEAKLEQRDRGALAYFGAPILVGGPAERGPSVLLITLDTTRIDAIGAYGGRMPTPVIDRLADEGILFERAYTASNTTLPSHVSILTGLDVRAHGVVNNRSNLDARVETLAEVLRRAGWYTAAAVSVHHLEAGRSGLGAGFDYFLEVQPGAEADGAATVSALTKWIDAWPTLGRPPFFLWVHLFDPHTPYRPPKWFVEQLRRDHELAAPPRSSSSATIPPSRYTREGEFLAGVSNPAHAEFLYGAGVAYTDRIVGGLLARLRANGMLAGTAIVLVADHGEALGDQDVWFSHAMLYPPVVRVPLLLYLPGIEGGRRVSVPVSTTDIATTLTRWLGVDELPAAGGWDLLDTLEPDERATGRRVWFAHSELDQAGFWEDGLHYFETLHRDYAHLGRQRVIALGTRFLFRDSVDPECARNLAEEEREVATACSLDVRRWDERRGGAESTEEPRTQAELRRLEALGYGGDDE